MEQFNYCNIPFWKVLYHVSYRYDEIGPDLLALEAGVSEMIYQTLEVILYTVKRCVYLPAEDVKV